MTPGSTFKLSSFYTYDTKNFKLDNCTSLIVDWDIISGEDVVSISQDNGADVIVTGLKAGTAVIQITTIDGDANTTTTCEITVQDISVSFDQDIIYVKEDYSIVEKYQSVAHAWIAGEEVPATWTSADSNLATIDYDTGAIVGISTDENPEITVTMTGYVVPVIYSSIEGYEQVTTTGKQVNDITIRQQVTASIIQNLDGVEKQSLLMYKDETYDLIAIALPSYSHNMKLNWEIVGEGVIEISKSLTTSGEVVTVSAIGIGTSKIEITSNDGIVPKILATCDVRVKGLELKASHYDIFASRHVLLNPESTTLSAFADGIESEVMWEIISGQEFATLASDRGETMVLTAKTIINSTEDIIIRATTIEADANTHKDIIVTLKNPVDTIELSDYDVLLYTNTSYDVDAMITNNSYNKALNWSKPSISSIAVSRDTHRITITAGEKTTTGETITVTANDGRGATNTLTVVIRKLVLSADSVYMTPGSTVELGALYTFDTSDFIIDNCVNLDVDWAIISGEDVIKLSSGSGEKITVTGLKAGTAVVQATTIDGDANTITTCTFVVQDIAISFDQDIIYVKENNSIAEKYLSVAHAWIEGVEVPATWTSADSNLATIDYDTGAIVGISTDENPEITVTMTGYVVPVIYSSVEGYEQVTTTGKQVNDITIRQQVTSAVIQNVNGEEKTSLLMYEYETYDLVAVTAPTYAHNNKVNWSVIGSAVKVMKNTSASGEAVTIQALTAGTATIQITSNDGVMPLVLAECQVRVKNLTLHADDYSIFASRVCVYNPQRTTLRAYVDGLPSEDVDWKIIVGYNYADLQESSGSAVTLIPRTMVLSDFILVIRATTTDADANTSKTINITVKNPVETISLSDYEVIMYTNTSCNVDATISNNAFNKLLDWSTPTITGIDISEKTHTITINAGEQTTTGEVITVDANDGRGATNSLTVIVRKFLLSAESAYITPGSTFKLSAMYTFDTSDFTIDNCTPLSSNWEIISGEDIVSISSSEGADIIVTGLKAGTAVIEATAPGDATTTLRCEVTVQDIAITFDQDIIYVKEDNSIVEKYLSVAHAWIAGEEVPATWTSADSNLVTIDYDTGDIVGISTGEEPEIKVTITGYVTPVINSYVDGYEQVLVDGEQTNDITVRQQVTSAIICDDTDRNRTSITIYTGTTYNLKAIVSPEYSHNKKVNWTILSDHAELSHEVSESGEYIGVTGLKPGITTIQIVSNDGVVPMVLAECEVIVKELSLNYNSFMIYTDGTITLRAYSKIYGTVDQSVTWSIDDTDVATLDRETGEFVVVTGGKGGNTYITATTTDADANTSMQCEVIIKYVLLEIDKDLIYVEHPITDPNNYTINARALVCEIPTDCRWEFTTMDSLNSTVTQNGIASHATLIGVDTGTPTVTITITVTTIDATEESGNISDSKTIEVRQQAYNIYPERNHLIMYTDTSYDSYTTIGPDYIFDRTTVWEVVDGEGIVEIPTLMPVEDMGKVTINAVKGGNATIRISANDRQGAIEHLYVVSKHLTLSHTDITIFKGDTLELTAFANGNPNEVIWSVGDESVVKIAKNKGYAIVLEPQEIGETTITAETFDADINIKLTTSIRVLDMRVEAPINEIYVGEQTSLTAFINYVPETVKWTVSDSSVATISEDNNGTITVTGVSSGEVEIVAESIGYTVNGKRSMKIRVLQHVTDIKLDKQDVLLYVGGTYPFGFTVEPGDADTKSFATYLANYSIIAGFSDTDNPYVKNLTGNRVGKETFYVAANDKYAFTTTGTVTVKNLIIPEEITVEIGSKYSLTAYAATTNAQIKQSVIWRVEGDNISIDTTSGDTVQITGNAIGTAKLYATTTDADGNVTKVCNVRVSEYAIHVDTNVLYTGETMNAYVTINGTKTACTWTSSDENVITVSGTGSTVTVNAIGTGKATITATAPDGYTMEASVEVKQAVESIELNKTEIVIYGREKHSFTATINPMNATDMNIQITHTDASLMLLSKSTKDNVISFEIAPLKAGEDIITLTAADGKGATASIRVVIKDFDIDLANNVIYVGDTVTVNALISNTEITATENVVWSIGDSTIASLDAAAGLSVNLTGNSAGETTLTATTVGGDVNRSVSRTIIVKQAVESITLDRNAITMTVNSSAKLNIVSILPATATNKNVTWQNSNSSVVSLYTSENSATLVASKVGTATITVVANDGKGASATCVVTVEAKDLEVSGLTMYVDSQATVKFNTDLIVGWDGIATWTSSDESIVKIVSNEMNTATLKAISAGEAVVTATTAYHNGTVTGTHVFNITVKEKLTIPTSLTLYKGTTYELSAGDVEVQWKSEHVGYVACTNSFGKSTTLQALNVGTTKVIATVVTADVNVTYACTVTVKDVSISCSNYNIWIGETASLSAMSGKEINENVVWSANNDNIKFDKITGDDITVTGMKAGTTVVTVTTVDGDTNTSVSTNITVKQPVTKLTMKSDLTVFVGSSATLTVVAMPSTATTPNVIWSGYDESIVSVETKNQKISSYATITGLQSGTTTITATAADGQGASATCNITVIQKVSSITLPQTCIVYVGKTATLDYTVLPAYAENTNVEWISSDSNIATVNATTGLIKGISAGTVKITCKATDGSGVSADCLVTVIQFVTNITLDKTELDMYTNYANTVYTAKLNIAKVYPENASNVNVKWESDKPEYITVDDNGLLTVQVSELPNGLTYETVTITCIALDGSGVRARCTVTLKQSVSEVFIIDYEKFFVFNNGMITGLTDYAYEKLKTPNIAIEIPSIIGGETVVEIGEGVFKNCDTIRSITVPSSVMYIGSTAFEDCDNLTDVYIMSSKNKVVGVPWGATNATIHWLDITDDDTIAVLLTITAANRHLIGYTGVNNETLVIPEHFYDANGVYYKVVAIGDSAFANCNKLTKVVLPDSVTKIEANAFSGCSALTEITLSENIRTVGDYAFSGCSALKSISFSVNIKTISQNAFNGCTALRTIAIDRYYNEVLYGPWGAPNATVVWKTPA